MKLNIATAKINQKDNTGQSITIDQKYEKSANISAKTSDFQNDNQNLRAIINENDAVIQMENLTGLEGRQNLTMMIGVMPDHFDKILQLINNIKKSTVIYKIDSDVDHKNQEDNSTDSQ